MKQLCVKFNKCLSFLLCFTMLMSILPIQAFAIDDINNEVVEESTELNDSVYDVNSDTEAKTFIYDENGNLISSTTEELDESLDDLKSVDNNIVNEFVNSDSSELTDIDSDNILDNNIDESVCECDGDVHKSTCSYYVEDSAEDGCSFCGSTDGNHSTDCELYEEPISNEYTCNCLDSIHSVDCYLYKAPEEENCTCDTESNTHSSSCPLYEEVVSDSICTCNQKVHTIDCPLYEAPVNECTCGAEAEIHLSDCPLYVENVEDESTCDCELIDGLHDIDCSLYIVPVNECTCGSINDIHVKNCALYTEPIISCTCNTENDVHSEECPLYVEIPTCTCGSENDIHTIDCVLYVEPKASYDILISFEALDEIYDYLYGNDELIGILSEEEKDSIVNKVESIYSLIENPTEEDLGLKNSILNLLNRYLITICLECGLTDGNHTEDCINNVIKCDECEQLNGLHLENCSYYILKCSECGMEDNQHLETCSLYKEDSVYELLLDCSNLVEMYSILNDSDYIDGINELSESEIEEVIYYVGIITDDEDLEIEILMLLYELPNAPLPPWMTLENTYIYFDLSAGMVTIDDTSYSGYIYQDGVATLISGEHTTDNEYYVYQSNPDNSSLTYDASGVPVWDRVTHDGDTWGDYITNNTNISGIVNNWTSDAQSIGRNSTSNYITVTGGSTYNIIIDNIWSSYISSNTSRTTGGVGFVPTANGVLTLYLKGDNRVGNIHYNSTLSSTAIVFENGDEESNPGTITCASFDGKSNHYNAVIGGNDNTKDSAYGITINSGIIYAGSQTGDNCSAIGAGGNGYGKVYINGGTVTAVANSSGAAIGGGIGESSQGGNAFVEITDGEVYAYNFGYVSNMSGTKYFIPAAAIGGGSSCKAAGNSTTTVNISGGYVFAQSLGGAAIGGGSSTMKAGGAATINISGDAIVEAQSISGTATNGDTVVSGVSIGGGTAGAAGTSNGGNITLNISGGKLHTGSIGGGSVANSTGKIGSGTVTVTGGEIYGQIVMGAGAAADNSFVMSDGIIDNSLSPISDTEYPFTFLEELGGAVYLENGTATVSGGTIMNASAIKGGAVYVTGGNFEMFGGIIEDCSAEAGGAIYVDSGNFEMNDGTIQYSLADNGGAIYINGGNVTMHGGTINDCEANIDGGAIYVKGGNIDIYDGTIDNNTASNNGGAIYATSDTNDILINVFDGQITNNTAGNHAGAIGASVDDNIKVTINIGEEECLGVNTTLHDDNDCPIIENNVADIFGGAFCLHGNSEGLLVNVYCGEVNNNSALRYPGSNTINQEGGKFAIYGGIIDPGVMVGGGIFEDNRLDAKIIKVRFWGNYEGAPAEPVIIECTLGVTLNFPANTYVNGSHELSGWTNVPNSQTGWVPVGGQYAVYEDGDEYIDYYAVWDATVSYIVYIPDTWDINASGTGEMDISADLNYFKKDSNLEVSIHSDFILKNVANVLDILNYKLTTNEPGFKGNLADGDIAASFQYNNVEDKTLTLIITDVKMAGTYEGVITFIVSYSEEE